MHSSRAREQMGKAQGYNQMPGRNSCWIQEKINNHLISDPNLEIMSKEQKDIRLQIENWKDPEKDKQLRKSRKETLKEMNHKVSDAREKRAEDLQR